MVVLVIVGLMTVLVIPRLFNSMTHIELKSSARQTVSILNQAGNMAYFQKKRIKVGFNLDTDRINVYEVADGKFIQIKNMEYSFPKGIEIKQVNKKEEQITRGMVDIFFLPNGNSSGGNIRLLNLKKREYEIEVDFITGSARIKE
jgi:Tfp pilus assembly protein FimT